MPECTDAARAAIRASSYRPSAMNSGTERSCGDPLASRAGACALAASGTAKAAAIASRLLTIAPPVMRPLGRRVTRDEARMLTDHNAWLKKHESAAVSVPHFAVFSSGVGSMHIGAALG